MDTDKVQLTPEVINGINQELAYQNEMASTGRADTHDNGLAGQLVALGTHADKARDAWTQSSGNEEALNQLRKCAAIAVRALVRFGCPPRTYPNTSYPTPTHGA